MKKDRAFQSRTLSKATGALFATLKKNVETQSKINKKLTEATHQARIDSENALREAKHGFAQRLGALHTTVVENDKKANKKIQHLTGVVAANAAKDAHGRMMLKMQSKANKLELKNAIRDAVAKGEKRAREVEAMAKKMNKKTQDVLNARITTEIGTLSKKIHSDIETLKLLALKAETQREIKKTNKNVAAYGEQITKHAKEVTATMKANVKTLKAKLLKAKP